MIQWKVIYNYTNEQCTTDVYESIRVFKNKIFLFLISLEFRRDISDLCLLFNWSNYYGCEQLYDCIFEPGYQSRNYDELGNVIGKFATDLGTARCRWKVTWNWQ
jgi:hypothetical protein